MLTTMRSPVSTCNVPYYPPSADGTAHTSCMLVLPGVLWCAVIGKVCDSPVAWRQQSHQPASSHVHTSWLLAVLGLIFSKLGLSLLRRMYPTCSGLVHRSLLLLPTGTTRKPLRTIWPLGTFGVAIDWWSFSWVSL